MSRKHHGGPAPVPPGNRPNAGPAFNTDPDGEARENTPVEDAGGGFQPQDPQRRLGGYTTAGEHARQQPGPANDGGQYGR